MHRIMGKGKLVRDFFDDRVKQVNEHGSVCYKHFKDVICIGQ